MSALRIAGVKRERRLREQARMVKSGRWTSARLGRRRGGRREGGHAAPASCDAVHRPGTFACEREEMRCDRLASAIATRRVRVRKKGDDVTGEFNIRPGGACFLPTNPLIT